MSRFSNLEFEEFSEDRSRQDGTVRDGSFYLNAARQAFRAGDFEQALRMFTRVLQYDPLHPAAWSGQVRMLIELGEYREAKLWADKGLEKMPREPELLAAKAVALARTGDLKGAMAFSDASVEEEGDTPYVWLARGDVLMARRERRAEYCFTKALEAAPRDWLWPWLASRIHCFYGRISLALKLVAQALELDAAQSVIWLQMGQCQLALGLMSAARNSFEQARELNPGCSEAVSGLAEIDGLGFWGHAVAAVRGWLHTRT